MNRLVVNWSTLIALNSNAGNVFTVFWCFIRIGNIMKNECHENHSVVFFFSREEESLVKFCLVTRAIFDKSLL